MIGIRSLASASAAAAALALGLGAGAPRPEIEVGARNLVEQRATRAEEALDEASAALMPAVKAARAGAARVVAGDAPPSARLIEAAEALEVAAGSVDAARRSVDRLEAARRAWRPGIDPLAAIPGGDEVTSIAAQLGETIDAADAFAHRRRGADSVAALIEDALAALEDGRLDAAGRSIDEARDVHAQVADWDVDLVSLPVWVETTGEMIGAVERIVEATRSGDDESARRAADEFAALAEDADEADRALRIAMAEGGSAVTSAPLGRLADLLDSLAAARAAVVDVRRAVPG